MTSENKSFLYFGIIIGKLFFVEHAQNISEIFKFREYFWKNVFVFQGVKVEVHKVTDSKQSVEQHVILPK